MYSLRLPTSHEESAYLAEAPWPHSLNPDCIGAARGSRIAIGACMLCNADLPPGALARAKDGLEARDGVPSFSVSTWGRGKKSSGWIALIIHSNVGYIKHDTCIRYC
jgi:hypothetical protein